MVTLAIEGVVGLAALLFLAMTVFPLVAGGPSAWEAEGLFKDGQVMRTQPITPETTGTRQVTPIGDGEGSPRRHAA